jgi:enterochelin esterase-like enzyme
MIFVATILLFSAQSIPAYSFIGTIIPISFRGPISDVDIWANVYVVKGYENSTERYPVIYNLHGLTGNQNSDVWPFSDAFEKAINAGKIGPAIIVYCNGYGDSQWGNSHDGTKPAETNVMRELIPYVDSHFRTIASSRARVIQGMSMGGSGSLDMAFKYPDSFCCVVSHAPALVPWSTIEAKSPGVFASYEEYTQYCPWNNLQKNADNIRSKMPIRIVVGTADGLLGYDRAMRDSLIARNIPVEYAEVPDVAHDYGGLAVVEGNNDFAFMARRITVGTTSVTPTNTLATEKSAISISIGSQEIRVTVERSKVQSVPQLAILDMRGKLITRISSENIGDNGRLRFRLPGASEQGLNAGPYIFAIKVDGGNVERKIVWVQ